MGKMRERLYNVVTESIPLPEPHANGHGDGHGNGHAVEGNGHGQESLPAGSAAAEPSAGEEQY
jgi:hypothetical protein